MVKQKSVKVRKIIFRNVEYFDFSVIFIQEKRNHLLSTLVFVVVYLSSCVDWMFPQEGGCCGGRGQEGSCCLTNRKSEEPEVSRLT